MRRFFKVEAKCGHVRRNNYIKIAFGIIAETKKEAAAIARNMPRVKHDHKDAIISVEEICYESYLNLKQENDKDPYLKCKNIQEQKLIANLYERLEQENRNEKEKGTRNIFFKRLKAKIKEQDALQNIKLYGVA